MSKDHRHAVSPEHIAIAAYYNAERRGFEGGREVEDWLDAEQALSTVEPGSSAGSVQRDDFRAPVEDIAPDQIHRVAEHLRVSAEDLRKAIQEVGPNFSTVKKYFKQDMR